MFVLDHALIPLTLGDAEGHSTGDVRIRQKLETEGAETETERLSSRPAETELSASR